MKCDSNDLDVLFRTIFRMRHNYIKKKFDNKGIPEASHPPILFMLKRELQNRAVSQKEIADKLGISSPTVAISIKRMEKAGLIHKVADESDLRRNLIALTDKGRQIVDESHAVLEQIDEGMLQGFSIEEQKQLKTVFLRIISNLEAMGAQPPEHLKRENMD